MGSIARPGTAPPRAMVASTASKAIVVGVSILVVISIAVSAAMILRQDVKITQSSQDSDIVFRDAGGSVSGFASVSIGTSGASATLSLTGVAGAANLQLTDLINITNEADTQSYSISLKRSLEPPAAVDKLLFTILDGGIPVASLDAAQTATSSPFTLAPGDVVVLRMDMVVLDATSPGLLGSIDLQFEITPVP